MTGPCDASDYSAAADVPKDGSPAAYLYDMVPYGVGLAVEAFDRMADLVERGRTCAHLSVWHRRGVFPMRPQPASGSPGEQNSDASSTGVDWR